MPRRIIYLPEATKLIGTFPKQIREKLTAFVNSLDPPHHPYFGWCFVWKNWRNNSLMTLCWTPNANKRCISRLAVCRGKTLICAFLFEKNCTNSNIGFNPLPSMARGTFAMKIKIKCPYTLRMLPSANACQCPLWHLCTVNTVIWQICWTKCHKEFKKSPTFNGFFAVPPLLTFSTYYLTTLRHQQHQTLQQDEERRFERTQVENMKMHFIVVWE